MSHENQGPARIGVEEGEALGTVIFPLFLVDTREAPNVRIESFLGTGFLLADELLVTCWHCVNADLSPDQAIVATVITKPTDRSSAPLTNITRDPNGRDLATANVGITQQIDLELAPKAAAGASDVWTYGYPLTSAEAQSDGTVAYTTLGRYLEGYLTRAFWFDHASYVRSPMYEIDMPAPRGLSGAPLVGRPGRHVYGVIAGSYDVDSVEELAQRDPETGTRSPEIVRRVSFAIAHYTSSLHELAGAATDGKPLSEFLGLHA